MKADEPDAVHERNVGEPVPGHVPPLHRSAGTIHYTELPEDASGDRGAREWNFYRAQVGRLLGEGHAGRWVLIRGEEVIDIWDTEEEANRARVQQFLMQHVLIQQVRACEPVLRTPNPPRRCPS